jgi:hypothetical protein
MLFGLLVYPVSGPFLKRESSKHPQADPITTWKDYNIYRVIRVDM